jgi:predicted phosphohydrolase
MAVYAISDLHLPLSVNKNMNVFGDAWEGYVDKIRLNWESKINNDDFIIIPGDISWAMNINEAYNDFKYINSLPGIKFISKGNHDFWWTTRAQLESYCNENNFNSIKFIHNSCEIADEFTICATKGYMSENLGAQYSDHDRMLFDRELGRLKFSLDLARAKGRKNIVVALHYPPFDLVGNASDFIFIMKEYGVNLCIYGHLHSEGIKRAVEGYHEGIQFKLISSDALKFDPFKLAL